MEVCLKCGDEFYTIPTLPELLSASVFSFLEHLDNRHFRTLFRIRSTRFLSCLLSLLVYLLTIFDTFIPAFIKSCPSILWQKHLLQLLPPLFGLVLNRLTKDWSMRLAQQQTTYVSFSLSLYDAHRQKAV
jgi:hypothetical protein